MVTATRPPTIIGRYAVYDEIASGGMATVHLGRLIGGGGFSRLIAIKRLHPQLVRDHEFASMFCDEARLCARIHHPNVVQTLDVTSLDQELLLVMEYVHGASFAVLLERARVGAAQVPTRIVSAILQGTLEGLHAAHEARDEHGALLGVVHRDVSPENILVGTDGVARLLDFGVAKAMGKVHNTRAGQIKGKLAYMSPEQARGTAVTRQSDIFSAGVVLWEALVGRRLFEGNSAVELYVHVLEHTIEPPSSLVQGIRPELEAVVMKALSRDPEQRFQTAREMSMALEAATPTAPGRDVGAWVEEIAAEVLAERAALVRIIEQGESADEPLAPTLPPPAAPEPASPPAGGRPAPLRPPLPSRPSSDHRAAKETPGNLLESLKAEIRASAPSLLDTPRADSRASAPSLLDAPRADSRASAPSLLDAPRADPPTSAPQLPDPPRAQPHGVPAAPGGRVGPHRIPRRQPRLRDRRLPNLKWPMQLIGAGIVLSIFDWALRDMATFLPFRLIWMAEVLVVAGVSWAFVRLFQQAISSGSRN